MKIFLLGSAAAVMALTGVAASAQPYHARNAGAHYTQAQYRHDDDRWRGRDRDRYNRGGRWREGQVYPDFRRRDRMVDWRRYRLPPPRPGYAYYRDDDGDVVMAALASGIIGMVLGNALSGGGPYYSQPYAYPAPAPAPYPYDYDYPY